MVTVGVAGNGKRGFSGDGGRATAARLNGPSAIVSVPQGGFLIAESGNRRVRRVWSNGRMTTVAGNGGTGAGGVPDTDNGDGGPATAAPLSAGFTPRSLAFEPDRTMLIDTAGGVRLVARSNAASLLAGAIRLRLGKPTVHGYRLHVVLTHSAQVRIRIYNAGKGLIATKRVFAPRGPSTVTIATPTGPKPGAYAIDARVQSGGKAAHYTGWVYLGERLSQDLVYQLDASDAGAGAPAADPNAVAPTPQRPSWCRCATPTRCMKSTSGRVGFCGSPVVPTHGKACGSLATPSPTSAVSTMFVNFPTVP